MKPKKVKSVIEDKIEEAEVEDKSKMSEVPLGSIEASVE